MKLKQTHMMYGVLTALAMIILGVGLYVANLAFKPGMNYVVYIPFLIGLILNAQAYAKANDNYVTFGNVFGSCFKACLVITAISVVWSFISLMIFPDMLEKGMEIGRQSMEDRGMSEEDIEQGMEMTRKFFGVFMFLGIAVGYLFFGAILSLIAAAIPKKKGALPEHMQP